jgi:hypothetical protein|tara:strand:+ start:2992 stop:3294 length:303 start_codon:yes stop_codon:yes gene_type:complete
MKKVLLWVKKVLLWIGSFLARVWRFTLSLFENHQHLHVTHTKYNSEGEVVDVLIKSFQVRKFYKKGPKHMYFKTMDGTYVELNAATPMDYMTETMLKSEI